MVSSQRSIESFVGLFLLAAIAALVVLAFKVSGLTSFFTQPGYDVIAQFDDIGSLKVRSPVKIGGVLIGEVASITLSPASFKAVVKLRINSKFKSIPEDSSASILTAGLLGDNYIEISPMYSQEFLRNGSEIEETHSAMILEKLIGQLIYKLSNPAPATTPPANNPASPTEKHANPPPTPEEDPLKKLPKPGKPVPPPEINYEHNI